MRYTHYVRVIHGAEKVTERLPFNESHGVTFDDGFNELEALRLVDQWNRLANCHTPLRYSYLLARS